MAIMGSNQGKLKFVMVHYKREYTKMNIDFIHYGFRTKANNTLQMSQNNFLNCYCYPLYSYPDFDVNVWQMEVLASHHYRLYLWTNLPTYNRPCNILSTHGFPHLWQPEWSLVKLENNILQVKEWFLRDWCIHT